MTDYERKPRHTPRGQRDLIICDFEEPTPTLRILFLNPEGKAASVTYRLCPNCGVTMIEEGTPGHDGVDLILQRLPRGVDLFSADPGVRPLHRANPEDQLVGEPLLGPVHPARQNVLRVLPL